jgi:hypothetical protein
MTATVSAMYRLTLSVFLAAVAVSIVHYIDNVARFERYTGPDPTLPWISEAVIVLGWFVLTATGVWGIQQLRAGERGRAALGLGVYSTSGLVGIAHFIDVPASEMDAFQLTFVLVDIALGAAIFAIAVWLALTSAERPATAPSTWR